MTAPRRLRQPPPQRMPHCCVHACQAITASGFESVMVNCNQMGEAAGVASYLALQNDTGVADVDVQRLRQTLAAGGSIII